MPHVSDSIETEATELASFDSIWFRPRRRLFRFLYADVDDEESEIFSLSNNMPAEVKRF